MREIKFEFLYKGLPYGPKSKKCNWFKEVHSLDELIEKPLSELSEVHHRSELVAKRQYTGLKDKNGVEIYEGDIVDCGKHKRSEVKFECGGFYPFSIAGWECVPNPESVEVIGNIHQNPELLNE